MQLIETNFVDKPGYGRCERFVLKAEADEDAKALVTEIAQSFCGLIICPVPQLNGDCITLYLCCNRADARAALASRGLLPWLLRVI